MSYCHGEICDYSKLRYVGWDVENNACFKQFFSPATVKLISEKITELTRGVDKHNRPIVVPYERICQLMDSVFQAYVPPTGDIYTRYIVPNKNQPSIVQSLIDQTIELAVSQIRDSIGMENWNESLTAWVQLYGDFNVHNLTQTPPIKVLGKRPNPMEFHMHY